MGKTMNKKQMSLVLNMLMIIFECIGFIVTMFVYNEISFEYYTEDSNILALLVSIIFVLYLVADKKIPKWLALLKYISTICLTITFIVVIFILIPMYNFDFIGMLIEGPFLYQHLLCPVLSVITFVVFDDLGQFTLKDNFYGMSLTALYGLVLIPLNVLDIIIGPYPFLMVKNQTLLISILWSIMIFVLGYIIAYILRKLYDNYNYRGV